MLKGYRKNKILTQFVHRFVYSAVDKLRLKVIKDEQTGLKASLRTLSAKKK